MTDDEQEERKPSEDVYAYARALLSYGCAVTYNWRKTRSLKVSYETLFRIPPSDETRVAEAERLVPWLHIDALRAQIEVMAEECATSLKNTVLDHVRDAGGEPLPATPLDLSVEVERLRGENVIAVELLASTARDRDRLRALFEELRLDLEDFDRPAGGMGGGLMRAAELVGTTVSARRYLRRLVAAALGET